MISDWTFQTGRPSERKKVSEREGGRGKKRRKRGRREKRIVIGFGWLQWRRIQLIEEEEKKRKEEEKKREKGPDANIYV